jgi:pyruvate/2-oxoglutarate dehydrogenase complex dihydrolipoamide dehydrogenase (E3) component
MTQYDAIVIGSGQGGAPLAHKLADLGWKVAIVEREHLGGSCINYGCTPTKTMIASARIAHYVRRAPEFGVHAGGLRIDMDAVVDRKNAVVLQWRDGQQGHIDRRPTLDLIRGHARFTAPREVDVDGQTLTSERIFINTGLRPRIPPIPGLDDVDVLTNRNIMDLREVPEHLLVLGGSYLGLEFGQMFRRFGAEVSVVEFNGQITPREDEDVATALQESLEAEGMSFHLGCKATAVTKTAGGMELTLESRDGSTRTLSGSHLLVAIGQNPNSDDLGLDKAGIETDEGGYIRHNGRLETSAPGVWVIGDVKGGPAFTHISYDDHLVIYDNLIESKDRSIEGRILPYTLYTDPELGRAGLSEKEARQAGYRLKVGSIPMAWVARAIERSETRGLMKVVVNADNDRILGAAILGAEGGELVQTLMTLMLADQPYTLFEKRMFIHPTLTEGFFTLMDNVKEV